MADLNLQNVQLINLIGRCKNNTTLKALPYSCSADASSAALSLKAFSHSFALMMPDFFDVLDDDIKGALDPDGLDSDLKAALLEHALKPYINMAGEKLDAHIVVDGYLGYDDLISYSNAISFDLKINKGTFTLTLFGKSPDSFLALYERISSCNEVEGAMIGSEAKLIRTSFVKGYTLLSLDELKSLESGDAIVMDCSFVDTNSLLVMAEDTAFMAELDNGQLSIKGSYDMTDVNESDEAALNSLGDLKLKVCFEIDSRYMSLKELDELTQGGIIDLNENFPSNVKLCVNNQIIGHGRIVDLGGRFAFEIASISKSE